MIGYLAGMVGDSYNGVNTIVCSGVGYEVHVNESFGIGSPQVVWVHEYAPQDAPHELYGFRERVERDLFRRLLDIKGVGPKVAMRVVASGCITADHLINSARVAILKDIRGVGATLAQRICESMQ